MTTSSNRKVYVALLGVAIAGFAVDRLFLSGSLGPEAAGAAEIETVSISTPASRASESRLSERVAAAFERAAEESHELRGETPDLFDPSMALGPTEEPEDAARRRVEEEYLRTKGLKVLSDRAWEYGDQIVWLDAENPMIGHFRVTGTFAGTAGARGGVILTKGNESVRAPFGQTLQPDQLPE